MQNGRKTNMNRRQQRPAASFAARSKPWSSNANRPEPGSHNAQRNYQRYLELARAEALTGNTVEQKTTTSTPNIISGRCPRTEGRHGTLLQRPLLSKAGDLSEPSSSHISRRRLSWTAGNKLSQKADEERRRCRDWLLRFYAMQSSEVSTKAELQTALERSASPCLRRRSPTPMR